MKDIHHTERRLQDFSDTIETVAAYLRQLQFLKETARLQAGHTPQEVSSFAFRYKLDDDIARKIANGDVPLPELMRIAERTCPTEEELPAPDILPAKPAIENPLSVFPESPDCWEYVRLKTAAMDIGDRTGMNVCVEDTWFDLGQDWKYTTLIARPEKGMSYQMLSPKQQRILCYGTEEEYDAEIKAIARKLNER